MNLFFLHPTKATLLLSLLIIGILTSCDISYSKGTSESSKTVSWHVGDEGYKKITKSTDGNEKALEANQAIQLIGGVISGYKPGLVIKINETREGSTCKAELKEVDGVLKLFVQDGELIQVFYKDEEAWLQEFLLALSYDYDKNSKGNSPALAGISRENEYEQLLDTIRSVGEPMSSSEVLLLLKGMESISMSSSRKEILDEMLSKELEPASHKAVAESIYQKISMSSDKSYLIIKLIKTQMLSGEAKEFIIKDINSISLSSQREEVLKALLKK